MCYYIYCVKQLIIYVMEYIKNLSLTSFFKKVHDYHLSYSSFVNQSGKAFYASYPVDGIVFVSRHYSSLDALYKADFRRISRFLNSL